MNHRPLTECRIGHFNDLAGCHGLVLVVVLCPEMLVQVAGAPRVGQGLVDPLLLAQQTPHQLAAAASIIMGEIVRSTVVVPCT